MVNLIRTNSDHPDFLELIKHLNADLAIRDGEMTSFFAQHNHVPNLGTVLIAYVQSAPVGCGAFKRFDDVTVEIKRMFVYDHCRGQGIASSILAELEKWAGELGYRRCVLETGFKQPEAIGLYEKNQYRRIPNFPPYVGIKESACFEKHLATR